MRVRIALAVVGLASCFGPGCDGGDEKEKDQKGVEQPQDLKVGEVEELSATGPGDIGGGDIAGAKTGSCLELSEGQPFLCMVYCGDQNSRTAAKASCQGDKQWSDEPACPQETALGVCRVDAMMCEQYCYPNPDISDADKIANCQETCGGAFEVF